MGYKQFNLRLEPLNVIKSNPTLTCTCQAWYRLWVWGLVTFSSPWLGINCDTKKMSAGETQQCICVKTICQKVEELMKKPLWRTIIIFSLCVSLQIYINILTLLWHTADKLRCFSFLLSLIMMPANGRWCVCFVTLLFLLLYYYYIDLFFGVMFWQWSLHLLMFSCVHLWENALLIKNVKHDTKYWWYSFCTFHYVTIELWYIF